MRSRTRAGEPLALPVATLSTTTGSFRGREGADVACVRMPFFPSAFHAIEQLRSRSRRLFRWLGF